MKLPYRENEWPMLDKWATPTFYFFLYGKTGLRDFWLADRSLLSIRERSA